MRTRQMPAAASHFPSCLIQFICARSNRNRARTIFITMGRLKGDEQRNCEEKQKHTLFRSENSLIAEKKPKHSNNNTNNGKAI